MPKRFFPFVMLCVFAILLLGCNRQYDSDYEKDYEKQEEHEDYDEQEEFLIDMKITSEKNTFSIEESGRIIVELKNQNADTLFFGSSLGELLGHLEKKDDNGWREIKINNIVFPDLMQINSGEQKEFVINTSGVISSFGEYRFVVPYQTKKQLVREKQANDEITDSSEIDASAIQNAYYDYAYFYFFVNE